MDGITGTGKEEIRIGNSSGEYCGSIKSSDNVEINSGFFLTAMGISILCLPVITKSGNSIPC